MKVRSIYPLVLLLLISIVTILPFFHAGFFPIHDNTQVARVFEMQKALSDGFFPVRLVQDLGYGYGYPIFNFYAPLGYYIGGLISLLGIHPLIATKIMIALGMVLSGISMYLLAKMFVRGEGAVIAGVLYLFAPYHAVNLYVRGAVAELFAYAFLPLAFYGLVRLWRKGDFLSVVIAGASLAAVILSHNLSALMLVPFYGFLMLYFLFKSKTNVLRYQFVLAGVLGLALSAFYWLPAFLETKYTSVSTLITGGSVYSDHFVCLSQLWSSPWGFGGSAPGCLDGLSFQIGKVHILSVLFIVTALFFTKTKRVLLFSLLGALVSLLMLLPVSMPVWNLIPPLDYLQFPWRYLQFVSFFLSLGGGISIYFLMQQFLNDKKFDGLRLAICLLLPLAIAAFYLKDFKPQMYLTDYPNQTQKRELTWTVSKISDEYLPPSFIRPHTENQLPKQPINAVGLVKVEVNKTQQFEATISHPTSQIINVNKAYFPSWKVLLNNHLIVPQVKNGIYSLNVPGGTNKVSFRFESTFIEKIADLISVIGVVTVLGIILMRKKQGSHAKTS